MVKDMRECQSGEPLGEKEEQLMEPDLYRVILLNDDFTTTDFVVEILVSVFHKSPTEAASITLDVHQKGRGVVGLYAYDIGSTKAAQVMALARKREFPLKCILEKA